MRFQHGLDGRVVGHGRFGLVGVRGAIRLRFGGRFGLFVSGRGIVLSRFEDGKIAEEWFNFDQLRLLQELGIIPSG